jgi:hypothetical protein
MEFGLDFRGVTRVRNDNTEIYGIWLGRTFVWPDPWTDIWDEGGGRYWEDGWHDLWSPLATS